jgi:hypothetical protein
VSVWSESGVLEGNSRRGTRPSLYELLQVSPAATPDVIQAAYRALARRHHPDVNPDPAAGPTMRRLNLAYQVLADPLRRARYDAVLRRRSIRRVASTTSTVPHRGAPPLRRVMLAPPGRQSSATAVSGPIARIVLLVVLFSLLAILVVATLLVVDAALDATSPYAITSSSSAQPFLNRG